MGDLGLHWRIAFGASLPWLKKHIGDAVEELSSPAMWKALVVVGAPGKTTWKPITSMDAVLAALRKGAGVALASEVPADLVWTFSPQRTGLAISIHCLGATIDTFGATAIDEVAAAVARLTVRWRKHAALLGAQGVPFAVAGEPYTFARSSPPQVTTPWRHMGAIVDVLDLRPAVHVDEPEVASARALARAKVPKVATRTERSGVVTVTFTSNLKRRRMVAKASAAHAAWLLGVLPAELAPGWNARGHPQIEGGYHAPERPFDDIFVVARPGGVEAHWGIVRSRTDELDARALAAAKHRTLKDKTKIDETVLVLSSEPAAKRLRAKATKAGYDRVAYRDDDGAIWDPSA